MNQEQRIKAEAKINELFDMILPRYIDAIPPISSNAHEAGKRTIEIERLRDEAGDQLLKELKLGGLNPLHPEMSELATDILKQRFNRYL